MRAIAAIIAISALGCSDQRSDQRTPAPTTSATATATAIAKAASARRPARRYYLSRIASRCEIYRVDDEGISPPIATPCPLDLEIGESIRIAGKTCIRESQDPERVEPVVCPDPLTNQEKRDLGLLKK